MSGGLLVALGAGAGTVLVARALRPPPRRVVTLARRAHRPARRRPATTPRLGRAAVAVAAVIGWFAWPPLAAVPVAAALGLPRWRRARAARHRRQVIAHTLPDVIDLLAVAVASGLTPALAIERLAATIAPPVGDALGEVAARRAAGARLAEAVQALPDCLGEPARALASAMAATERYGAALGPTLDLLAHEARQQRRHDAEAAAARLPVRLSFPLVTCLLPAYVALTVVPLLAGALRMLRG